LQLNLEDRIGTLYRLEGKTRNGTVGIKGSGTGLCHGGVAHLTALPFTVNDLGKFRTTYWIKRPNIIMAIIKFQSNLKDLIK
jgi:hypothetical protein